MYLDKLISDYLKGTPAWSTLISEMESVYSEQVWDPVNQLKNIRDPAQMEDVYLALTSQLLGFFIQSDLLSSDGYERIVESLSNYYTRVGTVDFVRFLSYILDADFTLIPLWTTDYVTFLTEPPTLDINIGTEDGLNDLEDEYGENVLILEHGVDLTVYTGGGPWYITSHVQLQYNGSLFSINNFNDIYNLFYYLAPANIVLDVVIETFQVTITEYLPIGAHLIEIF